MTTNSKYKPINTEDTTAFHHKRRYRSVGVCIQICIIMFYWVYWVYCIMLWITV